MDRKAANKQALQESLGLDVRPGAALVASIGRLAHQKGAELIAAALPALMADPDVQFVMLGTGDPALEAELEDLAARWPARMALRTAFSESLAHRMEAAADIFVMPSRYEPCGLNQMYSMRYGTVPVVRRTGGLKNTVICLDDVRGSQETATGFCFDEASPAALLATLTRAIDIFRNDPETWRSLMLAGMGTDFSWRRSALAYSALYRHA